MAYDLVPRRFFQFPSLPSIWDDVEDIMDGQISQSGLSISEDDKNVFVEAQVPGIDPKNVDVTFHDGYLWIRGEQKDEEKDKGRKYYRKSAKSFSYRVAVPSEVDTNAEPQATYKHGVMTVSFPKSEKAQPKKIAVKSEE